MWTLGLSRGCVCLLYPCVLDLIVLVSVCLRVSGNICHGEGCTAQSLRQKFAKPFPRGTVQFVQDGGPLSSRDSTSVLGSEPPVSQSRTQSSLASCSAGGHWERPATTRWPRSLRTPGTRLPPSWLRETSRQTALTDCIKSIITRSST